MKIFFYSVDIKIIVVIIMFNSDKHKTKILRKKNEKYILCIYSKYYLLKTIVYLKYNSQPYIALCHKKLIKCLYIYSK